MAMEAALTVLAVLAAIGLLGSPLLLALSLISPRLTLFWSREKSKKKAVIIYSSLFALSLVAAIALPSLWEVVNPTPDSMPDFGSSASSTPEAEVDYLQAGKDRGYNAAVMAQTANNEQTWDAVAERWAQAIAQLKLVPEGHPDEAEAKTKIEEYRVNLQVATTKRDEVATPTTPVASDLEQFMAWVNEVDSSGAIVANAEVRDDDPDILEVTVTISFLAQNKEVQREAAVGLQRQWASINNPTKPDSAYLWLRTPSGKRFGGSRAIGGTVIYIDD